MLIDLVSQSNYSSYNISIANLLGLDVAVYLNVILDINNKAIKKKKITDSFFVLNREYIKQITTLEIENQKEIDKKLISLGILEKGDKTNTVKLNISNITAILMSDNESLLSDISKIVKNKKSVKTKKEKEIDFLKEFITATNPELRDAYSDWIESVYAKQGWMSKRSVTTGQEIIDANSNRNLDIALAIINIAAVNGYRDMEWAVSKYNSNYSLNYKTDLGNENIKSASNSQIKLTGEVF